MGSEHYCLRWNNHQSNLLGVFSQLLQDESLVDVTLSCSEGAPIRAHKVVLSACSSYFQSLFLDHPERHPIVILKDVRFSELQTLVEFMYKGEVNVQYCQLSALLKTAESLKVKGLAEMTNQNTALRDPEREPDRLRPHSQPKSCESPLDSSGPTPIQSVNSTPIHHNSSSTVSLKREVSDRCSPSPPKRHQQSSPVPLDLYQRRCPSSNSGRDRDHDSITSARTPTNNNNNNNDEHHHHHMHPHHHSSPDRDRPNSVGDDASPNDIGINMSMSASGNAGGCGGGGGGNSSGLASTSQTVVVPSVNSSSTSVSSAIPSDLTNRPSSRGGHERTNTGPSSTITHTATSSGIASPIITEPVAGPSGLGPVQSVPLSLKKEIEWDRNDDKSTGDTLDYRHSHDSETSESPHGLGGGGGGVSGGCGGGGGSPLGASGSLYSCIYCGASFPHQSKLTRHILSHSLETLKFRETTAHLLHTSHIANLMPHELPPLPQHFASHRPTLDQLDPSDGAATHMEIEYAAAAVAAAANMGGGCGVNSALSISNSGGGSAGVGMGGVSSASAPNDPNSVVLCKFCGKSFPDVASLITHLPVHTGDRPFKCEFCGKAFKLRHHMKDHCRVHTGERPFRCSICGKTFSRSTILKAHEKTHFPKYVRKFLSPSPVDTKDELPQ